jgi:hypothetical protein
MAHIQGGAASSQNTTHDLSAHENLAPELQGNILGNLVQPKLRTGTGLPLPFETIACRKALFSCCLVSKLWRDMSLPLLYYHVIITDHTQLASLLMSLLIHKERRGWIYWFSFLAEYIPDLKGYYTTSWRNNSYSTVVRALNWWEAASHERTSLTDHAHEVLGHDQVGDALYKLLDVVTAVPAPGRAMMQMGLPEFEFENELSNVYNQLLHLVLGSLTRIKDILFTESPNWYTQDLSPQSWLDIFYTTYAQDPNRRPIGNRFLSLESIRKQINPRSGVYLTPDFLKPEFLASKKWELFRVSGSWFKSPHYGRSLPRLEVPRDKGLFSHVVDLRLYQSKTQPALLRVVLSWCQSLEIFYLTTNPVFWDVKPNCPGWPYADDDPEHPTETLQQALEEVRYTLTELRLGFDYAVRHRPVLFKQEEAAIEDHRVDVSGFPRLMKVDIAAPFRMITSNDDWWRQDPLETIDGEHHIGG